MAPLLGNQQLLQGGVLSTSARQLTISVSSSVSPDFSVATVCDSHVSGSFVVKLRPSPKHRLFCRVIQGRLHTTLSLEYLTQLFTDHPISLLYLCQLCVCFLYLFTPLPVGFTDAPHPLAATLLIYCAVPAQPMWNSGSLAAFATANLRSRTPGSSQPMLTFTSLDFFWP